MAAWELREHWRSTNEHGYQKDLWLKEIDDAFIKGWRVEWPAWVGHDGESFTMDRVRNKYQTLEQCEQASAG